MKVDSYAAFFIASERTGVKMEKVIKLIQQTLYGNKILWIINLLNAFYMNINVFIKRYCFAIHLDAGLEMAAWMQQTTRTSCNL